MKSSIHLELRLYNVSQGSSMVFFFPKGLARSFMAIATWNPLPS